MQSRHNSTALQIMALAAGLGMTGMGGAQVIRRRADYGPDLLPRPPRWPLNRVEPRSYAKSNDAKPKLTAKQFARAKEKARRRARAMQRRLAW